MKIIDFRTLLAEKIEEMEEVSWLAISDFGIAVCMTDKSEFLVAVDMIPEENWEKEHEEDNKGSKGKHSSVHND